jgi:methyl-accepting chemotaxis protein
MLTMRRHEKDFMLRHDAKYGAEMKIAADNFSALLGAAAIADSAKSDMKTSGGGNARTGLVLQGR